MRYVLSITAILILGVTSCISRIPRDPGVLVRDLKDDPSDLNPYTSTDGYAGQVRGYIYESLLTADNQTIEPKPWIAESWDTSPDGLAYTFHMRHDVVWSDGQPLTADDVVFSFNTLMDPKVDAAAQRSYYKDLKRVEKVNEFTVRFVFSKAYFRALEQCGYLSIIPKHIFGDGHDINTHPANLNPVGSGPYVMGRWEHGRYIMLEKNARYWNHAHDPKITGVQFIIITDTNSAFQYLKKGGLDTMQDLRAVQWVRQTGSAKFDARFKKYKFYSPGFAYIGWNETKPFFKDKRVRQAMSMLLNRQSIVDHLYYGQAMLLSGPGYYFGPSYDQAVKPWSFDPVRAVKLLDEAGWIDRDGDGIRDKDGVPFKFEMLYGSGSPAGERVGDILREELSKVGIIMDPRPMEFSVLIKMLTSHKFDAVNLRFAGGLTETDNYQIFHSSQVDGGSNNTSFMNPEADRLMEEIRGTLDPDKRKLLQYKLHALLHEEEPFTFLYVPADLAVLDRRFTNVISYPMGFDMTEWGFLPELRYME